MALKHNKYQIFFFFKDGYANHLLYDMYIFWGLCHHIYRWVLLTNESHSRIILSPLLIFVYHSLLIPLLKVSSTPIKYFFVLICTIFLCFLFVLKWKLLNLPGGDLAVYSVPLWPYLKPGC